MKIKNQQKNRKYHDRVAKRYDEIYENSRYWDYNRRITWAHLKPYLTQLNHKAVLDLGCGTGYWGLKLLKSGFEPWFLDSSQSMINQVREKCRQAGYQADERMACAWAEKARDCFAPESFSLVVAYGDILSFAANARSVIRTVWEWLDKDGIFLANADSLLAGIPFYLEKNRPEPLLEFLQTGQTQWLSHEKDERFEIQTFLPADLRSLLEQNRFKVLEMYGKPILNIRAIPDGWPEQVVMTRMVRHEVQLARHPETIGMGNHLEFIARKSVTASDPVPPGE
ncbi:MAG: class I SAM-dependent methyltransferase [Candidatus Delongbacteria bacterium]|nr:class I SAM-dependent methyltransferase [Candidatus Delongbacteria bacterium]